MVHGSYTVSNLLLGLMKTLLSGDTRLCGDCVEMYVRLTEGQVLQNIHIMLMQRLV